MSRGGSAILAAVVASSWLAGCAPQRKAQAPSPPKPPTSPKPSTPASPAPPAAPSSATASKGQASQGEETPAAEKPTAEAPPTAGAAGPRGAQTPDEQREALDRHLDSSLAQFDAMLLKEQQEVAAKRAEHAAVAGAGSEGGEGEGGSGTGAAPGGGTGQKAGAPGARAESQSGGEDKKGGRTKDQSTGTSSGGSREGDGRDATIPPEGTPPPAGDESIVPVDVGDGHDDDVVARQLREAAMKEQDPAIREKLWEEYRRYKRGGGS